MHPILPTKIGFAGLWALLGLTFLLSAGATRVFAQLPDATHHQKADAVSDDKVESMLPHSADGGKLYLAGQINFIFSDSSAVLREVHRPQQPAALLRKGSLARADLVHRLSIHLFNGGFG